MNWRPRNETEADLQFEGAALEKICKAFGCQGIKLSESLYHIDWCFYRGSKVVAFGEYKKRSSKYPTWILSLAKWSKGIEMARTCGVKFLWFIETTDGIFYYQTTGGDKWPVVIAGNSRGQNGDIEPCIEIPHKNFKLIEAASTSSALKTSCTNL